MRKKVLFTLLLLLVPGLMPSLLKAQQGPPPAQVRTAFAALERMAPMTQVAGTVVSRSDARLAAEVEGRLLQVADVGTKVEQGDVVAVIEDTVLALRQAELEAEATRAQARLRYLEAEKNRLQQLAKANLTSATQLEQTRSERDVARSELQVAQTRIAQVKDQLARTRIKAPFAGHVVERLARAGERVSIGEEVLRLVNPDALEVVARAPLEYIDYVSTGDELELRTNNRRLETGTVRTVIAVGSENTHVFEIRIDIPPRMFPVGQTLRVSVPTSDFQEVLAVPRDALVLRNNGIAVYVVGEDNTAQRISVQTGIGSGEKIEIQGQVNAGDEVVIRGNERLQPGQPVAIMEG